MSYLSKFAVGTEARGLGIGRDLWSAVTSNHKKIFWRSDPDKFITNWYVKQCDGMHKTPRWTVFWKGIETSQITTAIEYAITQDEDFV
jgi:acetylglutamate synthase